MNNFYTVLVIPEKTKQVKKVVLPAVYVRVGLLLGAVGTFFLAFMVYDYVNVMKQLSENKRLQTENRQLKQQMQTFTTKLQTVQDALERIQSYTTKLRIITNQAGENSEQLKKKVAPDIPGLPMDDHSDLPPAKSIPSGHESWLRSPLAPSRLLAAAEDDLSTRRALTLAAGNDAQPVSAPSPAAPAEGAASAVPATGTAVPPVAATESAIPALKAKPAKKRAKKAVKAPAPTPLSPDPAVTPTSTSSATAITTVTQPATSSPATASPPGGAKPGKPIAKSSQKTTPIAETATATAATSATTTAIDSVAEAMPPPPAPIVPDADKKLSDLIREDEERESAALRKEFEKLRLAFDSVLQHEVVVELDVESLTTALYDQRDYIGSLPTLKPTNGWYTSGFGSRSSPFTGKSTMHEGLDLANHIGSAIVATASGVVTYAGPRAGYGNLVTINHGYGIQTQYGHISRAYVKVGEKVKRGQKVAAVGNTGRSTGPHVHYEVRVNGIPMDPYYYILED